MKSFKKNQIVIYTFALMLVAAGYLNYTSKVNKDSLETANQETYVSENETSDIGDAKLVNSNDVVDENDKTNENVEENITDTKAQNTTENIEENKSENVVQTASNSTSNSDDYFVKSKLERETMYSQMLETYEKVLNSDNSLETQKQSATDEIKKIIEVCQENEIEVTRSVFYRTAEEVKEIVEICKENEIEVTGTVFLKRAFEIKEIVKVCKDNEIEITGSVFRRTATGIKEIVKVCKDNGIEVTGSVFTKNSKQLKGNIEYIKQNYGEKYLTPLIVSKNLKHLQKTLPYLQSIGVLETIKTSASILSLTLEEIKERQVFIESIGEPIVKGNKFNPIFGMIQKRYQKKVKEYEEKKKLIGKIKGAIQEGQELDKQINSKEQSQK